MKAEQFDQLFDDGVDIAERLDLTNASRPGRQSRRVNVDFPAWMVESPDREARRLGVNRQSIIKIWIAERLRSGVGSAQSWPKGRSSSAAL